MPRHSNSSSSSGSSSSTNVPVTVDNFFNIYADEIKAYINSKDDHPLWEPPTTWEGAASWEPAQLTHLNNLRIPALIDREETRNKPDMLLYQLGNLGLLDDAFPSRLAQLAAGNEHIYISNASGTGKTRLLFETLACHWGLYFTCTWDALVDPYGSVDLWHALRGIRGSVIDDVPFESLIPIMKRLSPYWRRAVHHNRRIAQYRFASVLLARLLIFQHFCAASKDAELSDRAARVKWLILQLRPSTCLSDDIFSHLRAVVARLDDADIMSRIAPLYAALRSRISFVAIDESNVAMHMDANAFTSHDYHRRVPVLRQLVHFMASCCPASRLLVAGTLLELDVVSEPIRNSASNVRSVRLFHSLGHFDSLERTSSYLRHFLGDNFPAAECNTIHAWCQGRHRILAVLTMYCLLYGVSRLPDVMNTLIFRFTGYRRSDAQLLRRVNIGLAFSDERLEELSVAPSLRMAILNYAIHRRPTICNSGAPKLVGIAAGLYEKDVSTAQIFEPLIMLNLARWLSSSRRYGIHGIIERRRVDRTYPVDGASFVEGLASCLRDILAKSPSPSLPSLLDFEGRAPSWALQTARLVLPRLSRRSSHFARYRPSSDVCVQLAHTPEDVFRWLDDASRPFLIPDPGCGAAMLFVVELADSRRLLMCLDQQFLRLRNDTRVLRDRHIVPLRPDEFYRHDPANRARLFSALSRLSSHTSSTRRHGSADLSISKHNILNLLCFSRLGRPGMSYDPPAAMLELPYLLQNPRPVEFEMSDVLDTINRT